MLIKIFLLILIFPAYGIRPILNIYTYNSFSYPNGPGQKIKDIFEKKYNCEIKFISMGNSISLLNRLKIEGSNSKADIVIGLDNNMIYDAEKTGLFIKNNIDISNLNLPKIWNNKTFIPYDYSYFSFIFNKKKVMSPPKSFQELINNKTWTIIYEDPRTSTLGLGLLLWVQKIYGDQSKYIWKEISKKTITITKGWSDAYNLFLKGEADFMFSYTTSILPYFLKEKNNSYDATYFSEGHYLQVEVAGQLISSKQPTLAKKFMKFILSKQFQKIITTNNLMYPVINIQLPKDFKNLLVPKIVFEYSAEQIKKNHIQWINKWINAIQ